MSRPPLLTTDQVAEFVANGYLRFDAIVPDDVNRRGLEEMQRLAVQRLDNGEFRPPDTGTPLSQCYRPPSAIGDYLRLPAIAGIITSLVGSDPLFDHDWTHHIRAGETTGQHLHVDAVVDSTDPAFDIQLFWFPHDVAPGEGGTRFVPGSHLHRTHSRAVAAYQHVVGEEHFAGPAGTVLVFHHGLWHAGQPNRGPERWMHKVRLNPAGAQERLWDTSDLAEKQNTPADHIFATVQPGRVGSTFRTWQPWLGVTAQRHETIQRARLWRYLTGDAAYDVDHYLTRLEQRPVRSTS